MTNDISWKPEYIGDNKPNQDNLPYFPSDELKECVKLAIKLERPLLLMGEPGSGKTRLAKAIVDEFTQKYKDILEGKNLTKYPYETWYVKSTSRARDGLYIYDAIGRLRDAQLAGVNQLDEQGLKHLKDPKQEKYIKFGALGEAFKNSVCRTVVLIDEIDKADIDFPNDLLLELDEKRFFIEETQTWVPDGEIKAPSPIIIITSNNEKDLPDAFLRRCVFHYLDFPDDETLIKIIQSKLCQNKKREFEETKLEDVSNNILEKFLEIRGETENSSGKKVSTSELIDWVEALIEYHKLEEINDLLKDKTPYLSLLLKTQESLTRYQQ